MSGWTAANIPDQKGKVAVVTGATGGLGLEIAAALARAGAHVIVAGRSAEKGSTAVAEIERRHGGARTQFEALDVADLGSVAHFAERFTSQFPRLDLLINNAGVMAVPDRHLTVDGFELQLGTNYLGHFALTLRLLPQLRAAPAARIVGLSSVAHWTARIDFDDLNAARRYRPWKAYGQSKLALLMFARALQRHATAQAWPLASLGAHPGMAFTNLQIAGPSLGRSGRFNLVALGFALGGPILGHSAAAGALPALFAATSQDAVPGGYYGPKGPGELRGPPHPAHIARQALDQAAQDRLWSESERLTQVTLAAVS